MSTGWTVVLAVSIALNVILGYRESQRLMWKAKRKTGRSTRSRGRTSGKGTPPKYYRGRKYGGYGNQRQGGRND